MIFKGEVIFLRLLAPVLAGIFLGLALPVTTVILNCLLGSCALFFTTLLMLLFRYRRWNIYLHKGIPGLVVNLLILVIFSALTLLKAPLRKADDFSAMRAEAFLVKITSDPVISLKTIRFEVSATGCIKKDRLIPASGKLLVSVSHSSRSSRYRQGDLMLIPARFSEIEGPLNPFEFDYKSYLGNEGIYYQSYLQPSEVKVLKILDEKYQEGFAGRIRRQIICRFYKYVKDNDAASIASTLILGYKTSLRKEVLAAYSGTGVMHVLSVSGMHVALVMIMLDYGLWFMKRKRWLRITHASIVLLAIWFYSFLTGFSPAVCRAAVMISFVITGKTLRRNNNAVNNLAASAVVLLAYNPIFIKDVGFQLSYLAVFGLVFLYQPLYQRLKITNGILRKIWSGICVSLAAQLATFPLCMYYFNQFPLYFIISNLLITIPVMLIMYVGVAFMLIPVEPVSNVLGWILLKLITSVNAMLLHIASLPYAQLHDYRYGLWYYVLLYGIIIMFSISATIKSKSLFMGALACSFLVFSIASVRSVVIGEKNTILFYSAKRNLAIGFFCGRDAYFVTDIKKENKQFSYSLMPVIDARKLSLKEVFSPSVSIANPDLFSDGHFYSFSGHRILLWNRYFNFKSYSSRISVDYLLLSGNPTVELDKVRRFISFKMVVIGGDNSERNVRKWIRESRRYGIRFYLLKKRPALEIDA